MADATVIQVSPVAPDLLNVASEPQERTDSPVSRTSTDETTALIDRVHGLLENRPACMAGRRGCPPPNTSPRRTAAATHHTLPASSSRPTSTARRRHNRSSSLPPLADQTLQMVDITTEESATAPNVEIVTEFNRGSTLRHSTQHLKERVQERRKTVRNKSRAVKASCWSDLRYVKWPKIKSRMRVFFSYKLWRGHMKEIEGHFGTFVVSYFIFLRWLFILNIVIFALWFGFVTVPQIIQEINGNDVNTTSQTACLIPLNDTISECSNSSLQMTGGTRLVYSIPSNCTTLNGSDMFEVRSCITSNNVAVQESGDAPLRVSSAPVTDPCAQGMAGSGTDSTYMVCVGVQPHVIWYQHILNFFTGQGLFNETLLFHGDYSNQLLGGYNAPLAFLLLTGFVYAVSIVLLVYKLGNAFNESHANFKSGRSVYFCNKLFTAWDFNIISSETAKLRRAHIKTDFQEELEAQRARTRKRSCGEWCLVIFIRFWTNLFVIVVLACSGVAIYYSALYELGIIGIDTRIFIDSFASAIVLSVLNAVLPLLFELIAKIEKFKTRSGEINMTLLRTILVRLSSLIVLLATLYILISCTQPTGSESTGCTISSFTIVANVTTNQNCPQCWETFIGQQFYKLGITNLLISIAATIGIETGRNIISRIKFLKLGKRIGKANFNIPKSTLDLIYTQTLLWLGFFFCPLLPAMILLTSFLLFYVKKYSLMWNLEPEKRATQRQSRNNFLFLFLILLALFAAVVPVAYAIARLRPSVTCGPFRGQLTMYATITNVINSWSCQARIAIDYFGSSGFIVPLIIFLLLLCYAEYVVLKAREARFKLIKKQLILEGANVTHIVDQLDNVLQELVEDKAMQQVEQQQVQQTKLGLTQPGEAGVPFSQANTTVPPYPLVQQGGRAQLTTSAPTSPSTPTGARDTPF